MTRLSRRFTAWLALFALLFSAAAPVLAATLVPPHAQSYAEVCTPAGIQRIAVGENVPAPATPDQKHCVLCLAGSATGALPASNLSYGVPEADRSAFVDAALFPRRSSARDRVAAPRGPPSLA
jgi:hypothetical protein